MLREIFIKVRENRITVSNEKSEFFKESLIFSDYQFSAQDINADEVKLEALWNADCPHALSELRSLLEMAQNVSRFNLNYSAITADFCQPTKKDVV
jgi:hypothetical protein